MKFLVWHELDTKLKFALATSIVVGILLAAPYFGIDPLGAIFREHKESDSFSPSPTIRSQPSVATTRTTEKRFAVTSSERSIKSGDAQLDEIEDLLK